MNSGVRVGIAIPQTFPAASVDPRFLRAFVTRAEALGYDSLWVLERMLGTMNVLDPIELLTFASAITDRVRLGAAVLLTALRSPVHLAKALATLDHVSGGRLIVGVGLGGDRNAYPAYGYAAEARVARFTEGLRVVKALWTEEQVTFDGRFFKVQNATMAPPPVQRPHPPLWFGGHHPDALARAATMGDGFIGAGIASTPEFADQVRALARLLANAGRDPAAFPIGKRVYLAIDRDRARAVSRLTEWFGGFYGRRELATRVTVAGNVQECIDGLGAVVAAGARLLILNPVFDEMEHLERLAAEVAPKL